MLTSLLLALRAISRNRVRAALTVLGILIGVASLIAVTTLGSAVLERISGSMNQLSSNGLTVMAKDPATARKRIVPRPLTERDARAIARDLTSVDHVAPVLVSKMQIVSATGAVETDVYGTSTSFFAVRRLAIARGVAWTVDEERRKERVCVLGSSLATSLFSADVNPVGQTVRIGQTPCRVSAVLEPIGMASGTAAPNRILLTPIGNYRTRLKSTPQDQVDTIYLTSVSMMSSARASRDIDSLLRQRHRLPADAPADFAVSTPTEIQQLRLIVGAALSALLLCVASVSLIVGGIGVMNIMLVSVAERTREIGIRISIGATRADILQQFLIEAVVLTALGGIFGLALGVVGSEALGKAVDLRLTPDPLTGLVALATSGAIGVVFGYVPARRAASLDPVEALRSE